MTVRRTAGLGVHAKTAQHTHSGCGPRRNQHDVAQHGLVFPTTVIVDATGKPRFVVTGEYDWAGPDAARLIEPLLRNVSR
jgi:hypothetical protein